MASKYAEYDARANEADKRITELAARVAALGSGSSGAEAELKATIKTLEAKIKSLEAENASLKKAAGGADKSETKKSKGEKPEKAEKAEKPEKAEKAAKGSPKGGAKDGKKDGKKDAKGGKEDGDKALFKAALKEGGKKGQDICGLNEMGGVVFFHLAVQDALGRWDLMEEVMKGFNTEVDEAAEDRKGGAGHLCKALLSAGDEALLIYCHVPKEHAEKVSAKQWAAALRENMGPKCKTLQDTDEFVKIECPADPNNNLYPLKMRDSAIGQGFAFLRKKNLVMDQDDDDDVDYGEMAAGADISWGGADY